MGPLSGLKVVDLTHVKAGPTCTLMLADMGGEVIKIEKIPAGDDTRYMVPPKIGDEAASFLMMNRNKKGIALDLKKPSGAKGLHRLKTGQGQWVETSLFEAALVQTYWQAAIALATGVAPKAMGSAHPLNAPYQAFEASDKWIVVGGANQKHWLRTLEVLGASELARDPRFATGADRMAHLKELEALLAARFVTKPAAHWLSALEDVVVPCGPVNDMLQALADPQTITREMVVEVGHSSLGNVKTLGLPIKFSQTPGKVQTGAPLYGEHTAAVLSTYGFDADEIAPLQEEGAVATTAASVVSDHVS